jgi:hypothetical protein
MNEETITTTESVPKELSSELRSLKSVVDSLLVDLLEGRGDRDKRRQVEEWMKALADKYPEFGIEAGLRNYYLAEAERLRAEFDASTDLTERLAVGRSVETCLEKAGEIVRKA